MGEEQSATFYRDGMDLSEDDAERIDTFVAAFGFGPKYKPTPTKKHTCPDCGKVAAYYKEIHPDTDMNEIVLYCPDCGLEKAV